MRKERPSGMLKFRTGKQPQCNRKDSSLSNSTSMLMYTGKVCVDIISVALGNHVLNFFCASKHGDGSQKCFVLWEKTKMFWTKMYSCDKMSKGFHRNTEQVIFWVWWVLMDSTSISLKRNYSYFSSYSNDQSTLPAEHSLFSIDWTQYFLLSFVDLTSFPRSELI